MVAKVTCDTVEILKNCHCKACGWPVIDCCSNWIAPEGTSADDPRCGDWFGYCSNKFCENHEGHELGMGCNYDWIEKD